MLDQALIEREYPFLGDTIYMDGCQIGIPPQRTQQAGRQFMDTYTQAILTDGDAGFGEARRTARAQLARLVGGRPEEIAFTKNTTEGVAILAAGYPLGPGDNVVTCDLEHPCNLFPWINASNNRGFSLRIAKTRGGTVQVPDLIAHMDDHTKVVAISAVQSGTGDRPDLAALAQACHQRGAILAVDAIQAVGRLDVNVRRLGIDYLACGGYKGLLAGFGVGFVWCDAALIPQIMPAYAGAFSSISFPVPPEVTTDKSVFTLREDSVRLESGTYNSFGICMLSSSVSLLLELGMEHIEAHVLRLEKRLRQQLAHSAFIVVTPQESRPGSGMVVAYYPAEQYERVEAVLAKEKVMLTHRPGYLRLVLSFHNTAEQVDMVARALCGLRWEHFGQVSF